MWIEHPQFQKILHESWVGTNLKDSFSGKTSQCGADLSQWARKEFGSVRKRKKELTEKLTALQSYEEYEEVRQHIRVIEAEMDQVLKAEETMWFQRSRALWLKDGDRNSAFFHQKASHRKKRNTTKKFQNKEGLEVTKIEEISTVLRDYYVQMFSSERGGNMADTLDAVECKVTAQMNSILTQPFSAEEVIRALKQMHPAKAPGPNGMTPLFFQKFWSIVNSDVLEAVLGILNHSHDPRNLNHTHIVLIPKVKSPCTPKDFRPISL